MASSPRQNIGVVPSTVPRSVQHSTSSQRVKRRSTISSTIALLEAILSAAAVSSVSDAVLIVLPGDGDMSSCLLLAIRSGACLALATPFLMLVARGVMLVMGQRRHLAISFAMPRGTDEHEVLDLYFIGAAAGVLGCIFPALTELGHCAGALLKDASVVWIVLAVLTTVPGTYLAIGACLEALAPAEGLTLNSLETLSSSSSSSSLQRPRTGMWTMCGMGHVVLVSSCFYSPDVHGAIGYILGFVHMMRLLRLAFAFPGN